MTAYTLAENTLSYAFAASVIAFPTPLGSALKMFSNNSFRNGPTDAQSVSGAGLSSPLTFFAGSRASLAFLTCFRVVLGESVA